MLLPLDPRIVFDGAMGATLGEVAADGEAVADVPVEAVAHDVMAHGPAAAEHGVADPDGGGQHDGGHAVGDDASGSGDDSVSGMMQALQEDGSGDQAEDAGTQAEDAEGIVQAAAAGQADGEELTVQPWGQQPWGQDDSGDDSAEAPLDAPVTRDGARTTLAFVDQRVENWQGLVESLPEGTEVHVFGQDDAAVATMADVIGARGDVDTVMIFSHGGDGWFRIGADEVNTSSLDTAYETAFASIGEHLNPGADILVYGCSVAGGGEGQALVEALANLTGADVAASDDPTGSAEAGGDWDLEVRTGVIGAEAAVFGQVAAAGYSGILAAPNVSDAATGERIMEEDSGGYSISDVTVSDADGDELKVTITVVSGEGTVTLNSTSGLTGHDGTGGVSGDGTDTLTFRGSVADINTALNGMAYNPTLNFNGDTVIRIDVVDVLLSESVPGSGVFDVETDGMTDTLDVDITVTAVNDAPYLDNSTNNPGPAKVPLTVQEEATEAFGDAHFQLEDVDLTTGANRQVVAQEMVKLASLPTEGELLYDGSPVIVGTVIPYADIIAGKLTYTHDGSDVAGGETDSFTVTLNDGGGSGDVGPYTIDISLTPKNEAPTISGNASVYEGQGTEDNRSGVNAGNPSDGALLSFTIDDEEIGHADALGNMSITIDQVNLDGEGTLFVDLNNNGQADGGEFTDGDDGNELLLEGGATYDLEYAEFQALRFAHDGSEPDGVNPSFRVTVEDAGGGEGVGNELSTQRTIEIEVLENDDDPYLVLNTGDPAGGGIDVLYNTTTVITNLMLRCADVDGAELVYTLTSIPTYGEIRLAGVGALSVGGRFTQADIDAGDVSYVEIYNPPIQNGEDPPVTRVPDSFTFQVQDSLLRAWNDGGQEGAIRDGVGDIAEMTFQFNVLPVTGGTGGTVTGGDDRIVVTGDTNLGINTVSEEDNVATGPDTQLITDTELSFILESADGSYTVPADEVYYRVTTLPSYGQLQVFSGGSWSALSRYESFTQDDIDNDRVRYVHNGGEYHLDSFDFSLSSGQTVYTNDGNFNDYPEQTFNIVVTPTNDAPVATGGEADAIPEGGTRVITTALMGMSDVDTANEAGEPSGEAVTDQLWFRVTDLPLDGTLQRWDGAAWQGVDTDDWMHSSLITNSGLRYVHGGGDVVSADPAVSSFVDTYDFQVRDDLGAPANYYSIQSHAGIGGNPADTTGIDANLSNTATVTLNMAPLNDAPIADVEYTADGTTTATDDGGPGTKTTANVILEVAEGGSGGITTAYLQAVDPDSDTIARQFRITENVKYGTLFLNTTRLGVGATFTQDDIDNNRLSYTHNGTDNHTDYFYFIVSDSVTDHVHDDTGSVLTPTGGSAGESRFDIRVTTPYNDPPTVSVPNGPIAIDDILAASNPIGSSGDVSVDDPDIDDTGLLQVTVRLTRSDGTPFGAGEYADYTITSSTVGLVEDDATFEIDDTANGSGTYLELRGRKGFINDYLANLQVGCSGDPDASIKLEVVVDDRTRNVETGALLTAGVDDANGGELNDDGGTGVAVETDDFDPLVDLVSGEAAEGWNLVSDTVALRVSTSDTPPTVTVPATQDVYEDVPYTFTNISVADPESTGLGLNVTVTLSVDAGKISVGSLSGVSVSNNNSATVTLTGTADKIDTLLVNGVTYTSNSHDNSDSNAGATGDVTLTVSLQEGAAAVGNEDAPNAGDDTVSDTVAITILPVNDAPLMSNATNVTIGDLTNPVTVDIDTFVVTDPNDTPLTDDGETDQVSVIVRLTRGNGTPLALGDYAGAVFSVANTTVGNTDAGGFEIADDGASILLDGDQKALILKGTIAQVNDTLATLQLTVDNSFSPPGGANLDGNLRVEAIVDDRLRNDDGSLAAGADGGTVNQASPQTNAPVAVPTTNDMYADPGVNPYGTLSTSAFNLDNGTATIFLSSVNDPADITASNVDVAEGSTSVTLDASNADITIADPDDAGGLMSATVTLSEGTITALAGLTNADARVDGIGTGTVTLTGVTEAQLNTWLKDLTVTFPDPDAGGPADSADWSGAIDVTIVVNDEGNTGSRPGTLDTTGDPRLEAGVGQYGYEDDAGDGDNSELVTTRIITITSVPTNDAPELAGTSENPVMIVSGAGTGTTTAEALLTGVTASDIDILTDSDVNSFGGGTLTITFGTDQASDYEAGDRLAVAGGVLTGMDGAAVGGSGGSLTINLTNDCSAANVAAILEAIRYSSVDADPTDGGNNASRTYNVVLNDGNNNNDGGATDGVNDAGGDGAGNPNTLDSNVLTGTITFRLPPEADPDTNTMSKSTASVAGDVSTNDSDPEHTANPGSEARFTVTQVDSDNVPANTGGAGTSVDGEYGSVVINSDGTYTYTLDRYGNSTVYNLTPPAELTEVFTYEITDNDGQTATATLTITIDGNTQPPDAEPNEDRVTEGDTTPATGNVLTDIGPGGDPVNDVDRDPDGRDNLLVVSGVGSAGNNVGTLVVGTYGTVAINANGSYTYTLDQNNAAVQALNAGDVDALNESFTYFITDEYGQSDSSTLTIYISGADQPPVATDNFNSVTDGGRETATGNVVTDDNGRGVDRDPDGNDANITVTQVDGDPANVGNVVGGRYGTVTVNADGTYTYDLNGNHPALATLYTGDTLRETFTYQITDEDGDTDTATLTITINGSAQPPVTPPPPPDPGPNPDPRPGPNPPPGPTPPPGTPVHDASRPGGNGNNGFSPYGLNDSYYSWEGGWPPIPELWLVGKASDRVIQADITQNFQVPKSIFMHTDPSEKLMFSAEQANGKDLPDWLSFDEETLTFRGTPPPGHPPVEVVVIARDSMSHEARARFTITVQREIGEQDGDPGQDRTELEGGLLDREVAVGRTLTFTLPAHLFMHQDMPADVVFLSATLPDGRPLPDWVRVDLDTGRIVATPPPGAEDVEIIITAKDAEGNEAQARVIIKVGEEDGQAINLHGPFEAVAGTGLQAQFAKAGMEGMHAESLALMASLGSV